MIKDMLVDKKNVVLAGDIMKYVDYYELFDGKEIIRFFPKVSVWSDPRYDLLTFPYGDFPLEFTSNLPRRDGNKHKLKVKDFNTGKINEKKRGACEDNFLDPAQGRVTGLNDIWQDHPAPKELATMLDSIPDEYSREEAFKFFGYVKAYSSRIDRKNQIPYELMVDFEPEKSLVKAITEKIKAGSIKFFGSDKIFQITDIESLSVISKDKHPFLEIVLKSEMIQETKDDEKQSKIVETEGAEKQPEVEFIDLAIKDLRAVMQELETNKKRAKEEKIKIESEKDDLKKRVLKLEEDHKKTKEEKIKIESEKDDLKKRILKLEVDKPKEGEVTFIVRRDDMSNKLQIGDNYEIINKIEIDIEKIGNYIGIKMIKKGGNGDTSSIITTKNKEKSADVKNIDILQEQTLKKNELKFFERTLEPSELTYNLLLFPRTSFPDEFLRLLPNLGEKIIVRDHMSGHKVYTNMDNRQYRITGLNPIWKRYPHLKAGDKIGVAIDPYDREIVVDFKREIRPIISLQKSKGRLVDSGDTYIGKLFKYVELRDQKTGEWKMEGPFRECWELLPGLCKILKDRHENFNVDFLKNGLNGLDYFSHDDRGYTKHLIPGTDMYVQTHFNNDSAVVLCHRIIKLFGYSEKDLRIYVYE